jgi:hypothetical protein
VANLTREDRKLEALRQKVRVETFGTPKWEAAMQKVRDEVAQIFEVDVRGLLEAHNEKRVKLVNKSIKDRTEHLEPARVRDLKMTVVTVAQF